MAEASVLIFPPLGPSPGPGSVTSKNVNIRNKGMITEGFSILRV